MGLGGVVGESRGRERGVRSVGCGGGEGECAGTFVREASMCAIVSAKKAGSHLCMWW